MEKKYAVLLLLLCNCFLVVSKTLAQNEPEVRKNKGSHGLASLNFLSNNVYLGRAEDTAIAYLTPLIGYHHSSGIYIDASASYALTGLIKQFDLFSIDLGYDFFGAGDKLYGSLLASKYFYNNESQSVKSAIKTGLYGSLGYDQGIFFAEASAGAYFAGKTDLVLSTDIGHNFYALKDKLLFSPSFYIYAGTQHFYTSLRNKKMNRIRPGMPAVTLADQSNFKLLDYEFSLPASYESGKFTFSLSPSYAIPVNPVVYPNNPRLSEKVKNRFYFEAEMDISF